MGPPTGLDTGLVRTDLPTGPATDRAMDLLTGLATGPVMVVLVTAVTGLPTGPRMGDMVDTPATGLATGKTWECPEILDNKAQWVASCRADTIRSIESVK